MQGLWTRTEGRVSDLVEFINLDNRDRKWLEVRERRAGRVTQVLWPMGGAIAVDESGYLRKSGKSLRWRLAEQVEGRSHV